MKNEAGPKAQLQIDKSDAGVTGGVGAHDLKGGGVARNVQRILPLFFFLMGGVFWTDLKNSVGEVEAQNLHGSGVDRNVQRMLLLLFFKNMGGVFLTDLRNSVGGVEAQNLRGGGVAHN